MLRQFAREVGDSLGNRLECVTVFGSLVNGDYVSGFSDLDQVVVVPPGRSWKRDAGKVQHIVHRLNRRQKVRRLRLHEGYVVPRNRVWSRNLDEDDGLVPRDVRDLMLHGRTIAGRSIWSEVEGPTDEELRESAIYFVFWLPTRPPGLHALLNCIFAVAGARYRLATGKSTWTKRELVKRYGAVKDLPYGDLVAIAGALRNRGDLPAREAKTTFFRLLPRYQEYLTSSRGSLRANGMNRIHIMRSKTFQLLSRVRT